MAKRARKVFVEMGLVVVGLAGITPAAFAAKPEFPAKSMTLMVLIDDRAGVPPGILEKAKIDDRAGVPPGILEKAKDDATRVFQNIGIGIVWLEHGDARLGSPDVLTTAVIVRLLPRAITDLMNVQDGRCGTAASGTRVAYVFFNRIEGLSSLRNDADTGDILGQVIAHEMGHLLLPPDAHSRTRMTRDGHSSVLA